MYLTLSRLYHQMKLKRKTLFMMFSAGKQAIELATHRKCNAHLKLKVYTCTCITRIINQELCV